MMRINRMKKVTSKNIFAWMMCFTMVLSVLAIGNVSYATEVIETTSTVEFESVEEANAFTAPEWFGEDVTNDGRYHNSNMLF